VIINIFNDQNALILRSNSIEEIIIQILEKEGCVCDEVSIHLVSTETICDLHDRFFQDPSPTDCISFPLDEEDDPYYRVLGEVFVCPETAINYSNEHGMDPYEETTLYLIHGILHLLGYDDIEDHDRLLMREAELKHLTHLKDKNLILRKVMD
jgi:probable rRNA maturation factor